MTGREVRLTSQLAIINLYLIHEYAMLSSSPVFAFEQALNAELTLQQKLRVASSSQDVVNLAEELGFSFTTSDLLQNSSAMYTIRRLAPVLGRNLSAEREQMLRPPLLDPGVRLIIVDNQVPTLTSGRLEGSPTSPDEENHRAAKVRFEETIPFAWNARRGVRFSLNEGIAIRSVEFAKCIKLLNNIETGRRFPNCPNYACLGDGACRIIVDGSAFAINGIERRRVNGCDSGDLLAIEFILFVSVKPGFDGKITLGTQNNLFDAPEFKKVEPIVIANAHPPLRVNTTATAVPSPADQSSMLMAAPIELREACPGALSDGSASHVEISLVDESRSCVAGFDGNTKIRIIEGDIKLKNIAIKDGLVRFDIGRQSTIPSAILISDVSVDYGSSSQVSSCSLLVGGSAIAKNSTHITLPHEEPDPDHGGLLVCITKELFEERGIECKYISVCP
jgi:predicted ribosomally synthesized peptide with nif11-like leader